ncbi:DNA cytosine methyltransferase [Klebsiella pneumoniae]|jgi:DNA (cytosine-5)-methyltransferase 1|uniref:DNA cytosine methyltransferase n=1 Tax=Klebsiella pneumoniae TaxID=573 RepID=UPI0021A89A5E|nr:DNA cytosine methyltransferase [Klebsiella pneumoniae]EIX9642888.1 DNA cytosine methyltransferase [Klebsiella pneumoniae]MDP1327009.1 DNA cytosine methyltransferase [Klebsiella pneumoniae]MDP1349616.1 DNA cytosine methyltransferase [Klebsiella pneumoniae]MDP1409651.1 DNA cytosine methyltransferase [Klebsiella pneumoniae]HBX7921306.1 DNA cytosine methyltransferase [Klebsiella pneumoniae]
MTPSAYYNEIDPFAAQWLRNLIAAGHIAPGEVDERSIEDVTPDDLRGFTQCHFFAGIGVWSHSLRLAGWPDDRPVWTGSCPCQPFSPAGKGDGFADERHLWPQFFHLISERRPQHVFGEQVAAGNANAWFDLVQTDLEGLGYAFGLVPFTSAGIGAPHIRERAYWVANATGQLHHQCNDGTNELGRKGNPEQNRMGGGIGGLGNANVARLEGLSGNDCAAGREGATGPAASPGVHDGLANTEGSRRRERIENIAGVRIGNAEEGAAGRFAKHGCMVDEFRPLEVNGFWRDADWLLCRDGKWRPVEPGTFPLVDGAAARLGRVEPRVARVASSNRVGRLKGYGNAINAQAAAAFIRAYMGVQDGQ